MAIAALRFRPETNLDPLETKGGSYIYDGSVARCHEWEFRTMARIGGLTEPDELRKGINRVIEGLRGDAFDLAMDIGREKLMTIDAFTQLVGFCEPTNARHGPELPFVESSYATVIDVASTFRLKRVQVRFRFKPKRCDRHLAVTPLRGGSSRTQNVRTQYTNATVYLPGKGRTLYCYGTPRQR